MLGLANPDMLATQMASAGIGPEIMAPQLGLGGLIQPSGMASEIAATAPGAAAAAPPVQVASTGNTNEIFNSFMGSVKRGLTNPNGLAAVAATGQRESGFSPNNAFRSWDDVGKPAGGIMSWRDGRLNNLVAYARSPDISAVSPEMQGEYFLHEAAKSGLLDKLNAAKTPQEAMAAMNADWAFKGSDNPNHPETIARMAAVNDMVPLVGGLGGPAGNTGSSIDFNRAGSFASATPAISPGGTGTQQESTGAPNTLPTPVGGGISAGGKADTGVGSSSQAAAVLNSGQPPAANAQQQTLGQRLAALGKGMGDQKAFQGQKDDKLQPTGAAPQVGSGYKPDPNALALLAQMLGGASGTAAPSLAAMIQPRR